MKDQVLSWINIYNFLNLYYIILEFLPRHLAVEIQRVEREYQNQQVELRLVAALAKGQEYFDTNNFSQIDTKELEDVSDLFVC